MAITEATYLKQIEIAIDHSGAAFHVFSERVNIVERDGVVIAQTTHRDSLPADSNEAKDILGEATAASLAGMQKAQAERDVALAELGKAVDQIGSLQAYVAELNKEISKLK